MYTFWSIASVVIIVFSFSFYFPMWLLLPVAITGFWASLKASEYVKWFMVAANGIFLLVIGYMTLLSLPLLFL